MTKTMTNINKRRVNEKSSLFIIAPNSVAVPLEFVPFRVK